MTITIRAISGLRLPDFAAGNHEIHMDSPLALSAKLACSRSLHCCVHN